MRLKREFNLPDIMQLASFIDLRFVGRHVQRGAKLGRYYLAQLKDLCLSAGPS